MSKEKEEEETSIDVCGDGGILKTIKHPGNGDACSQGMHVSVHYTGRLEDGKQFDSSRDRGQPFDFTLGQGLVIRGWDVGVLSMKIGERAILKLQPDYGYGSDGAGGVIPPNAVLEFDIELLGAGQAPPFPVIRMMLLAFVLMCFMVWYTFMN